MRKWITTVTAVVALVAVFAGPAAADPPPPNGMPPTTAAPPPPPPPPAAPSYPTTSVDLTGHGWGHGFGMGQWGTYGYAVDFHYTAAQILDHFYAPSVAGTVGPSDMTVRLVSQDALDLVVTSPWPFHAGGSAFAGGTAVRINRMPAGTFQLYPSASCGQPESAPMGIPNSVVTSDVPDPGNDLNMMLQICRSGHKYAYRGSLSLAYDGMTHTVNSVPIDQYVRGVVPNESPSSWGDAGGGAGMAALQAQAVAARTYSLAENRYPYAKTCDTTSCQVYSGAGVDGVRKETTNGDTATFSTTGMVRTNTSGAIMSTQFSSSTGGYSASGGIFAPVVDEGDVESPYHNWAASIPVATVQAAYPTVGTLTAVTVTSRNGLGDGGGRVVNMTITGTGGSVNTTGTSFQSKFALRSNWFFVAGTQTPPTWSLENGLVTPTVDVQFMYGNAGDRVLACDWNNDGKDTPAVFRNGVWYLRNSLAGGAADITFAYGNAGDTPICGDWNGDGIDTPGVIRNGVWYLRNANSTGVADITFGYGNIGDTPVVGDWNGDGKVTPGLTRNGVWYLRNANSTGVADITFGYGNTGDTPLAGDWNADGTDTIAVKRGATYYLRNATSTGVADVSFDFGGPNDAGVAGDWDVDHHDTVGAVSGL